MGDVRVRKIDEWVVNWFRTQAKRHGRSLESELRDVLTGAAAQRKKAIADEMRANLKQIEEKYGLFSDSAKLMREDRDARG